MKMLAHVPPAPHSLADLLKDSELHGVCPECCGPNMCSHLAFAFDGPCCRCGKEARDLVPLTIGAGPGCDERHPLWEERAVDSVA